MPPVIHAVWMVDTNRIKESGVRGGLNINFHLSPPTAPSHTDTALALGINYRVWYIICLKNAILRLKSSFAQGSVLKMKLETETGSGSHIVLP